MNVYNEFREYKRFTLFSMPSLGLDLLSVEETPPFLPELFGIPIRAVNETLHKYRVQGNLAIFYIAGLSHLYRTNSYVIN